MEIWLCLFVCLFAFCFCLFVFVFASFTPVTKPLKLSLLFPSCLETVRWWGDWTSLWALYSVLAEHGWKAQAFLPSPQSHSASGSFLAENNGEGMAGLQHDTSAWQSCLFKTVLISKCIIQFSVSPLIAHGILFLPASWMWQEKIFLRPCRDAHSACQFFVWTWGPVPGFWEDPRKLQVMELPTLEKTSKIIQSNQVLNVCVLCDLIHRRAY